SWSAPASAYTARWRRCQRGPAGSMQTHIPAHRPARTRPACAGRHQPAGRSARRPDHRHQTARRHCPAKYSNLSPADPCESGPAPAKHAVTDGHDRCERQSPMVSNCAEDPDSQPALGCSRCSLLKSARTKTEDGKNIFELLADRRDTSMAGEYRTIYEYIDAH